MIQSFLLMDEKFELYLLMVCTTENQSEQNGITRIINYDDFRVKARNIRKSCN